MNSDRTALDWLALASLILMWGSAFAAIKFTVGHVPPAWLAAIRLTGGALLMVPYALVTGTRLPRSRYEWTVSAILGVLATVIPFILINQASQSVPSGIAGLMMAATPFLVLLMSIVVLPEETITRARVAGLVVGFGGVALIMVGGGSGVSGASGGILPYLALLVAASGYALNTVTGRKTSDIPHATRAYGALITGAVAAIAFAALTEPFPTSAPTEGWLALAYLIFFPTFLATLVLYALVSRTAASFVSLTNYAVPATAIAVGAVLFGEQLAPLQYAGFVLVIAGIAIAERRRRARPAG